MRFYGVHEDKVPEIMEKIEESLWIFEEDGRIEKINREEVRMRIKDILQRIKEWKEKNKFIPPGTIFFFVSTPDSPKAIKIYHLSSLGCSVSLDPPKWKIYKEDLQGKI